MKGGDNETDAGFQGLVREAVADNPDLLISLYSDAGCLGMMRGRATLGITIPVVITGICSSNDVISQVDPTAPGLGGLGLFTVMSLAEYANRMQADGLDVTGASLYDHLGTTDGLTLWPGAAAIDCGFSPTYPAICSFVFPFAEYQAGREVVTITGLEAVSSVDYLP